MNRKILILIVSLLAITVVSATAILLFPFDPLSPPRAEDTGSTSEGVQTVVDANNQFAFELYNELNKIESGNIFISPYSISAALAMTYEGAAGETAREMESVFHFPESSILRTNFASIYNELNKRNKAYELRTGNALWVQEDFPLLKEFSTIVETYYGGRAVNLDLKKDESKVTINEFIEEQTNGKITEIIPKDANLENTKLIITNAIYFKGNWEWEFDKSNTRELDFKISPENNVQVPMMSMVPSDARFNYGENKELQIIELPYKGEDISMLILLPKENLESLEDNLSIEKFNEYKSLMYSAKVNSILLPKFEFKTEYILNDHLSSLGMLLAFDMGLADFSAMNNEIEYLWIDSVIHQTYVKVDEKGTEAAAATAVRMDGLTSVSEYIIFQANHPFIFIIQQKETGNILFLGKVVNPIE